MSTKHEAARVRLKPFLIGKAAPNGEQDAHCPLHKDKTRSMRVNFKKGLWKCFAGCGEGKLSELLALMDARDAVKESTILRWHRALLRNKARLKEFRRARGLTKATIEEYQIGWDEETQSYTIPIRSADGVPFNVRHYRLGADSGRKIWSVKGLGTPRLFPEAMVQKNDALVICEGELDALIAIQNGFPAVTGTGGATAWNDGWAKMFEDKSVVVMYDNDEAGRVGSRKVARSLSKTARVWVGHIPLKKPGSDVTDLFVKKKYTPADFRDLLRQAREYTGKASSNGLEPADVSLQETFNASLAGKTLRTMATVKGKRNPPFLVPQLVKFECSLDKGKICAVCPMEAEEGSTSLGLQPEDPLLMRMIDSTDRQVDKLLFTAVGARCNDRITYEVEKHINVEELFVRPSIELADDEKESEYIDRKVYAVGRYNTQPNQTIEIVGSMFRDQESQRNMFAAFDISTVESSLDHFEMTPALERELSVFRPRGRQRPITRLREVAEDISENVTRIYGRVDMHMAMDLVYHSALRFKFAGEMLTRGWLELLVVGDTRTGKSEAAAGLTRHYQAGRIISCESASFAGIVGGLQQYGAGREWTITWGAVPLNDRRLVILDEVSGLTPEQIGSMSSIRSSGVAQLTKIQTEQTTARTRLVWMSNPRDGRIADYTYGVHTLRPLIGNPEDIARFDFAMAVATTDVDPGEINQPRAVHDPEFHSDLCHQRVLWAWSRKPEQILWERDAERLVFSAALRLAELYSESPPLLQGANARVKIARMAVALAMATFSSPDGELVRVTAQHVFDAAEFLDWLYSRPVFGYKEISQEHREHSEMAVESRPFISQFINRRRGLGPFLRACGGSFRSQDLENILGYQREEAQRVMNTLWNYKMITKVGADIRIAPVLHDLLRDMREGR